MRILTAIIIKYLPYLIAASIVAGISGYTVHHWDTGSYNALQSKFSEYQTQVALAEEASQKAYTKALQDQISQRTITDAHNEAVIAELNLEKSHLNSTLFTQRLLA